VVPSSATRPPIPDAASQYWPPEPLKFVLDNGMRVMVVERAGSQVVELRFVFEGGFAADPRELSGFAGLAMAMFSEGALRAGSARLGVAQEALGATLRGRVTADGAVVEMSALAGYLGDALTMCAQVLQNPEFEAEDFELVRMNRLVLIAHERLSPFDLALRVLPPMIYGADHPYARPFSGSGTEQGVTAVTADDLRGYYAEHLAPERGTLVVTGSPRAAGLIALLEDTFGRWRTSPAVPHPPPPPSSVAAACASVTVVDRPHAPQPALVAAMPTIARNSSAAEALMAANAILAGTFTSRLNMSLRERKGWTYGVRSSLLDARLKGLWLIDCSVRHDRIAEAMTEIGREISNIAGSRACSPQELRRAVDCFVARAPSMYETCAQMADALANAVIYRLPAGYYGELGARLRDLNPGRVTKVCRQIHAAAAPRWMIVGDAAKLAGQLSAVGFGEIEIVDPERGLP
jgi:zinc protease